MKLTLFACGLVAVMIASTSHAQSPDTGSQAAAMAASGAPATAASFGRGLVNPTVQDDGLAAPGAGEP